MNESIKASLYQEAKNHVNSLRERILVAQKQTEEEYERNKEEFKKNVGGMATTIWMANAMKHAMVEFSERNLGALEVLYPSPYFIRCDVKFDNEDITRTFYFAKQSLIHENIFSWVTPAARIRFEDIGEFIIDLGDGRVNKGKLIRKDQFMIVDGKILFMTNEDTDHERTLIHQEHLSTKKSGFVLPEIVEQMEKAQDAVIRAYHRGSFLISGPAGSGKTTLALHRVAYLNQSPETAHYYESKSILVLVQDASTKEYFGGLLPELGIHDVKITTFADWARERLDLLDHEFIVRYGETEEIKDIYEFEKNRGVTFEENINWEKDIYETLKWAYFENMSQESRKLFYKQKEEKKLDRFDLTILLKAYIKKLGKLTENKKDFKKGRDGKYKEFIDKVPLEYSLIIVDEVQNYLPEQINLFKTTVNPKTNAMLYVGDLAQQTQLCTIKDWDEVNEQFEEDRKVVLQKVYRNTKQILEYIQNEGYKVTIPQGIKEGPEVKEIKVTSHQEEINKVKEVITKNPDTIIGILAKTPGYKELFEKEFANNKQIHVLTINESQGMEFDIVCIVGVKDELFKVEEKDNYSANLVEEKMKVNMDLYYVALTRAMTELYVFKY